MIEITFKDFHSNDFDDPGTSLYVVKNGLGDVLYVGISRDLIWNRWFSRRGHCSNFPSESICDTPVGTKIIYHLPESLEWHIQLWTLEDCVNSCECAYDLMIAEKAMIKRLSPALNTMDNFSPGVDTTPKSKRELEREKDLDETYNQVFNKRNNA